MKTDHQHLRLFLSHLPEYYDCLRLVYYQIEQSGQAGRTLSLFSARRVFSRHWHQRTRRAEADEQSILFQLGNDRALCALRRYYNKRFTRKPASGPSYPDNCD